MEKKSNVRSDVKIYSWCREKCCPVVEDNGTTVKIGEDITNENLGGFTVMSKSQFRDFVEHAKNGGFDNIIK